MRVLIVSTYFPPHVGGVEVVAQRQAASLAAAGHEVIVATSLSEPVPDCAEISEYAVRRLPIVNTIERRIGVPYPLVRPTFLTGLWRLVRWADVVHLHDVLYQPPQAAALLAALAGRPTFATQHVGPVNHPHPVVRGVERVIGTVAGRLMWRRARRVVSYNPMVTAHLRGHGVPAEKIVRSTIGVDIAHFAPAPVPLDGDRGTLCGELGLLPETPLVLFVGRMVAKKGYAHLLRAAGADRHIVLVGSGRPAQPLPVGVTFLGPLPRERLTELYRLAALFVLPSAGEIFPIVAQEAMASGLPVVLTDSPLYDEYGIDRQLLRLVTPDPDVLKATIDEILADGVLRGRMGAYSRALAERFFDASAAEKSLLLLYQEPGAPGTSGGSGKLDITDDEPGGPAEQRSQLWTSASSY